MRKQTLTHFGMHQLLIDYIVINAHCNFMRDMCPRALSDYDRIIEDANKLQLPIFQQMLNDCWQLNGAIRHLLDMAWYFAEFAGLHPFLIEIFCQCSFSNAQLKTFCSSGAALLGHVYSNVHIMYGRAASDIKFVATPNDALLQLFDLVAPQLQQQGLMPEDKDTNTLLGRHWNNKGNSMESLAIYM